MNKEQFFKKLERPLKKLPHEERKDIMQDFEEHFAVGLNEGKSEKEIAASLGSPQQISKELLAEYQLEKATSDTTTGNVFRALWAIIGLSFFNFIIVLGPLVGLLGIMLGGWVTGIALIISPLLVIIDTVMYPETFEVFHLFMSIGLSGLGILIAIGMLAATRALMKWLVRYMQYNAKLVKGGLKNEND